MSPVPEPPDWLRPAWDGVPDDAGEPPGHVAGHTGAPPGTFGLRVRSVTEVSRAIKDRIRTDDGLRDLWVEGEVGRVTVSSAGHAYFSLKDARAALQCVWFRDDRIRSPFQPTAGHQVVVNGRIDLFEPQGALQLYVASLQPAGVGNLALRFEELKARLAAEGLFDAARKRPLPVRPRCVAVVTSPTGAVWHDVVTVLARRWPMVRVVLVPCKVQGEDAPRSIARALAALGRWIDQEHAEGRGDDAPAVTILARGGGSLEDLWSFNDETVVRAVVAHRVPVVCGVGHEVDVTLADFAADVRAPTPSAAAELVVPDRADAVDLVRMAGLRATTAAHRVTAAARRDLDAERRTMVLLEPRSQLATSRERVGLLLDRATRALGERLGEDARALERLGGRAPALAAGRLGVARAGLRTATASLAVLGPEATLERGYAIVRSATDASILCDPRLAPAGTGLRIALAGGTLAATSDGPADG